MKTWLYVLLAGSAALAPNAAAAQTRPGFELGAEVLDYKYRERDEGQVVARDSGTFGGINAGYVETIGGGTFLRARLSTDFGSVDYKSDDGSIENVSQSIGQLELHVGHDIVLGPQATLTPFVGIGSRVLDDRSGGKTTELGLLGYDREVSYAYVPVGLALGVAIGNSGTRLVLSGQYDWIVGGEAKSKLSDVEPGLPDLKLDLDNGHGLEASALISLPIGRHGLSFGPFVRHWSLDRSKSYVLTDPEGSGEAIEFFEPKNRTTELGLKIAFAF